MNDTIMLAATVLLLSAAAAVQAEPFVVVRDGTASCEIVIDIRGSTLTQAGMELAGDLRGIGYEAYSLIAWGRFLAERIEAATGCALDVRIGVPAERRSIVIALAENYPAEAQAGGLDLQARAADPLEHYDVFCIRTTSDRLYILGHTELACRHGVATLLEHLGFRFYNPSPRWWVAPSSKELIADLNVSRTPAFFNLTFATNAGHHMNHGNGTETYLWDIQEVWYAMNRTSGLRFNPGPRFSAGPFSFDFTRKVKDELEQQPECFALLADGTRDIDKPLAMRKICVSSQRMLDLIVADRVALLERQRAKDRFRPMVSAEYRHTCFGCVCPACAQVGSPTDQMFVVVNEIARAIRAKHPDALAAVRVFGSDTPSTPIEPNVCVAVGHPAWMSAWRGKVRFLGMDFAVTGYVPGKAGEQAQHAAYYQQLARFCRDHQVRSLGGELAPAWGGLQTPLLYVATRILWDTDVDPEPIFDEYFNLAFGAAAGPMGDYWSRLGPDQA